MGRRMKKAAVMGGVAATSAAMTMGLTAPSASALPLIEARAVSADVQNLALTDALTLGPLLEALGVNLSSINGPLDALELAGINLVTTGPPFGLAALFGLNLGYVPALPPLIVDEVTGTDTVVDGAALAAVLGPLLSQLLGPAGGALAPVLGGILGGARVPVVIGFGLGSLAAGIAYPQIAEYFTETDPSPRTILPLILLRNPGRADGGIVARAFPLLDPFLRIFGYDSVVTPEVESNGSILPSPLPPPFPQNNSFIPIKIDATVEYDTLSDFPSWPNPFSLVNSGAAFLFPTYILRGADVGALGDQIDVTGLLGELLSPTGGTPNIFLTVPVDRLPVLEPFRYPTDIANFFTGGVFGFTNPFADAIEPALKILTNLGYTNVTQDMTDRLNPYPRDFTDNFGDGSLVNGEPGGVPFFTVPQNVDWGQVPGDLAEAFFAGVQDAFFYGGIPGVRGPLGGVANPIAVLADLLGLPSGLGGLADRIPGLGDALADLQETIGDVLDDLDLDLPGLPNPPGPITVPNPLQQGEEEANLLSSTPGSETLQRNASVDSITPTAKGAPDTVEGNAETGEQSGDPAAVVPEEGGGSGATTGPQLRGGQFGTALREAGERVEDSINEAGKRINDAVVGTQKTLTKVFTPKRPTVKQDDAPQTDTTANDAQNENDNNDEAA
ncbi:hypothetical protein MLIT_50760 [Mycolicibacterium litorale]|uniref:PE-PPE domain-containing protein n=1 Tax=Mycolicibacterium litorale TaxID=758802 RepID=A0AAD1MUH2_9MYCO|nr:hypothetical protein MLIT_50760 [Mycolicibacterium litorale]